MKVTYIGPFPEGVEVPYIEDNQHKTLTAAKGEAIECPDELAALLLEQEDNWRGEPSTKKPAKT